MPSAATAADRLGGLLRLSGDGRLPGVSGAQERARMMRALQQSAGNAALNRLLRQVVPPAAEEAPTPATLLVEDGAAAQPGQMRRDEFLDALQPALCAVAENSLGPLAVGCPWVEHWIAYYRERSPSEIEAAIARYAPEAASATAASECIAAICARVEEGIAEWQASGQLPATGEVPALSFKLRPGGSTPAAEADDVAGRLGPGRPLDSPVRARMGAALGADFDGVRVHDDPSAAALTSSLGARAMAVGDHIAFAPDQYEPGTPLGDALIAHELAHVIQQRDGPTVARSAAPLEAEADAAAVAAVGVLHAGAPATLGLRPALRSGLQLQRCSNDKPAPSPAPAPRVPRTETTAFGTWHVVADTTTTLAAGEIKQSDFARLELAWTRVNDGSGGLRINGSAANKSTMIAMLGREMARSATFRDLIIEITGDAAHRVTLEVGRDNAYWLDSFATNAVDLNDLEWLETDPPADYPWVFTAGEDIVHWLAERRYAAVHGGGFNPAHNYPMAAGGLQERYRRDLGQPGRIVSQVKVNKGAGLEEGRYEDTTGNVMIIRRDASAGDPVPYEVEYKPKTPTTAAPGRTRINRMVAEVRATSVMTGTPAPALGQLYVRFAGATKASPTSAQPVAVGGSTTYALPLGTIVPVGGPITVEVWRKAASGPDTRLSTMSWAHPFAPATSTSPSGGVQIELRVRLEKS